MGIMFFGLHVQGRELLRSLAAGISGNFCGKISCSDYGNSGIVNWRQGVGPENVACSIPI